MVVAFKRGFIPSVSKLRRQGFQSKLGPMLAKNPAEFRDHYGLYTDAWMMALPWERLKSEINSDRPILAIGTVWDTGNCWSNVGHAFVIFGWEQAAGKRKVLLSTYGTQYRVSYDSLIKDGTGAHINVREQYPTEPKPDKQIGWTHTLYRFRNRP